MLVDTGALKEIQWGNSEAMVNISTDATKDRTVFDEHQLNILEAYKTISSKMNCK